MSCEMWQATNVIDLAKLIRIGAIATRLCAATLDELLIGTRGEFVGARTTPKDFQTIKA